MGVDNKVYSLSQASALSFNTTILFIFHGSDDFKQTVLFPLKHPQSEKLPCPSFTRGMVSFRFIVSLFLYSHCVRFQANNSVLRPHKTEFQKSTSPSTQNRYIQIPIKPCDDDLNKIFFFLG